MNGNPGLPNPMMRENQGLPQPQTQPNMQQPPPLSQTNQNPPQPQPQISPSASNQSLQQQSMQGNQPPTIPQTGQNPGQQGRYPLPPNFSSNLPQNFRLPMTYPRNSQIPQIQMPMYQPQTQQPQQHTQKKTKKQSQKHQYPMMPKMSGQQFIPTQQTMSNMKQVNDSQRMMTCLSKLNEEKTELLYRLFDISPRKQKDKGPNAILELIPELNSIQPNAAQILGRILDLFANQDLSNTVRDPYLPTIFQRTKGTKPSFFITYKARKGFEYQPALKERRQNDVLIGTFISLPPTSQTPLTGVVTVDGKQLAPSYYGESTECFVIFNGEPMPPKFKITADISPNSQTNYIFTFFVIQMVSKKNPIEIAQQLCQMKKCHFNPSSSGDTIPCMHMPSCQIDAATLFETTYLTRVATCPRCGQTLLLKDLEFDYKQDASEIQEQHAEESQELENARMYVSDFIAAQLFSTNPKEVQKDEWLEDLAPDSREIVFTTTDEYIESIKQFDL